MAELQLVCTGRRVGDDLTPTGEVCGRRFTARAHALVPGDLFSGLRPATWAELEQEARAAGWRLGPPSAGHRPAACPRCARPDPAVVATCRTIEASLGGGRA